MSRNRHSDPLVSVLIPTHNRRWLVGRAIDSILSQSYKNVEVILVNDAGEDIQDLLNGVPQFNDPRLRYFQNEKNLGLAGTRNVALKHSSGEYICLLDDDDIYLKYAIEFRMYMMKKIEAEIVYTRSLLDHWEKKQNGGYYSVGKSLYWDSPFDQDLILLQNIAPCCNVFFSRRAWQVSNYWFDETMTTSEDHDFWCALSRANVFHELKIIDTECSQRDDKSQMTGSLNFVPNWIKIYQHWRHTARDLPAVIREQNAILERVGINPADYNL
jgi:glycosyltransferase involved in cell wall biosynthesis